MHVTKELAKLKGFWGRSWQHGDGSTGPHAGKHQSQVAAGEPQSNHVLGWLPVRPRKNFPH